MVCSVFCHDCRTEINARNKTVIGKYKKRKTMYGDELHCKIIRKQPFGIEFIHLIFL